MDVMEYRAEEMVFGYNWQVVAVVGNGPVKIIDNINQYQAQDAADMLNEINNIES